MFKTKCIGFTLVELILVILIIGIAFGTAIPFYSSSDPYQLTFASKQAKMALSFAQGEAMRTEVPYGVRLSSTNNIATVFKLDLSNPPIDLADEITVKHPLDNHDYVLNFSQNPQSKDVSLQLADFRYGGNATVFEVIFFDDDGRPVLYAADGSKTQLDQATITFDLKGKTMSVLVTPMTGIVSIL